MDKSPQNGENYQRKLLTYIVAAGQESEFC